jgi:hypothetical protein
MNSTNIWKKRLNYKNANKESNKILNRPHFKTKKEKVLTNIFKENLITNWIENEGDDELSQSSSTDLRLFHRKCQIKENDNDEDSLQLDNLQFLSTMKNIIFLDLENFSTFFQHLTNQLPNQTYIIAFQGSNIQWKPPKKFKNLLFTQIFSLVFVLEI